MGAQGRLKGVNKWKKICKNFFRRSDLHTVWAKVFKSETPSFPKDSKNLKSLVIGLQEVGALQLIERICPEGRFFKKNKIITEGEQFKEKKKKHWWEKNICSKLNYCCYQASFSLGPAFRPVRVMVLMCLSVCLYACPTQYIFPKHRPSRPMLSISKKLQRESTRIAI